MSLYNFSREFIINSICNYGSSNNSDLETLNVTQKWAIKIIRRKHKDYSIIMLKMLKNIFNKRIFINF